MKILVLASPMEDRGGVQRYTLTLVRALGEILGNQNIRMLAKSSVPQLRRNGISGFSSGAKLRYLLSALVMGVRWRPQLVVCAHIGVASAGRFIRRILGTPY